jgi:bifunctional enzyme CysN/CysC
MRKNKYVVWITGLSGSGKTTVAKALEARLKDEGLKVGLLDGDEVRNNLDKKYGYTLEERRTFNNCIIYMARNMFEFQTAEIVIVALISPLKEMRDNARDILNKYSNAKFIEVLMDTPLEICEERDPKQLYKKARAGEIKDFTGIDSPYEKSEFPEVRINHETNLYGKMTVDKAVDLIYNLINI